VSLVDFGDFRKATPGIMESWRARAPIDPAHCFIAVGSPSPGRAVAAKGTGVHWLKGDVSWVQYVVILLWVISLLLDIVISFSISASNDITLPSVLLVEALVMNEPSQSRNMCYR